MTTDMTTGQEPARRGRRKTGAKPISPQELARLKLDDADGDKETAVELVLESSVNNRFLADYLLRRGAETLIGEVVRSYNAQIFNDDQNADVTARRTFVSPMRDVSPATPFSGKESPIVSQQHQTRQRITAKVLQLLSVTLPNGKTLANARHADLSDAANRYGTQAKDMLHKSSFYSIVGRELPKGKKVGDVMDNVVLTNLWEQTKLAA